MIVIANIDLIDSSNAYIWISDMSIAKQVSVSAIAEGNGTAKVAKAILDGDNQSDKDYVNNTLLAGDYKAQYDEWVK